MKQPDAQAQNATRETIGHKEAASNGQNAGFNAISLAGTM
jgi:hypothetical protein